MRRVGTAGNLAANRLDIEIGHAIRRGKREVGTFFTLYNAAHDWHLAVAWVEGREVAAVFSDAKAESPSYFMEIQWSNGEILSIRDFRYARYVAENAVITLV